MQKRKSGNVIIGNIVIIVIIVCASNLNKKPKKT